MSLVQLNIMYGHLEGIEVSLRGILQVISPSRLVSIRSMGWTYRGIMFRERRSAIAGLRTAPRRSR